MKTKTVNIELAQTFSDLVRSILKLASLNCKYTTFSVKAKLGLTISGRGFCMTESKSKNLKIFRMLNCSFNLTPQATNLSNASQSQMT